MDREQVLNVLREYANELLAEVDLTDDAATCRTLLDIIEAVGAAIEAIKTYPEDN